MSLSARGLMIPRPGIRGRTVRASWCRFFSILRWMRRVGQRANIRRLHSCWGTADLLPTNDRCVFNPPKQIGSTFPGPHLHWDAELKPPMPLATQGIIHLTDTAETQGAFSCVPGFQYVIDEWLRALPPNVDAQTSIRKEKGTAIAGKAGDLIIWHQSLPRASNPNRAAAPRVVQYLNMFPMRSEARGDAPPSP